MEFVPYEIWSSIWPGQDVGFDIVISEDSEHGSACRLNGLLKKDSVLFLFLYMYIFLCEYMTYVHECPQGPEEAIGFSGAGVIKGRELPNMGVET